MNIAYLEKSESILANIPKQFKTECFPFSILKMTPFKNGYTTKQFDQVMNTISKYNNSFMKRFEIKDRTLIYHPNQPCCFEVMFTKDKVTYYFAVPSIYKTLFMNKVKFLLTNCDIQEVPDYIEEFHGSVKQVLTYKKNWMFSINTDKDINLNDNLLVLTKDLQSDDKVLMQYMMQPLFDHEWKGKWDANYNKFSRVGDLVGTGSFSLATFLDRATDIVLYQLDKFIDGMLSALFGEHLENEKPKVNHSKDLSDATKKKTTHDGFKMNMNVYYKTQDQITAENLSRNISTIIKDIDGDNSLTIEKAKIVIKYETLERKLKRGFIANTRETTQFIKTPSEKTMKEYEDILEKISVGDMEMPEELLNGLGILLGDLMRGSKYHSTTFGTDANSNSKPIVYISPQEGGKSSFLRMYAISALMQGHSIFAFDTIDGKTIQIIRDYLPKDFPEEKIVILDFRSNEYAFPLAWNEMLDSFQERIKKSRDIYERYQIMEEFGSTMSSEVIRFVDIFQSPSDYSNRLTPAMTSRLVELAQLVFMNGGTFSQIKDCLYDSILRHELLKKLNIPEHLPFYKKIMKIDTEGENSPTLKGIETRLNKIMENEVINKYFSLDKKIDFAHMANNGYCVLIQIPSAYSDPIITFLVQKLWLAITSSRYDMPEEKRPHTHLLVDEPNHFPTIMNLLNDHLIASRKWHLRFLFFIHNMEIFRYAKDNLKNAGTTFIMLPTSTGNFSAVSEFYSPLDFSAMKEVEKLISRSGGKRYYALVSLHYRNVWYPSVIRLPLPVEQRMTPTNRKHLNHVCAEKYGVSQREYYESLFRKHETEGLQINHSVGMLQ